MPGDVPVRDVKTFNSQYATKGYNLDAAMANIKKSLAANENIMLDTRKEKVMSDIKMPLEHELWLKTDGKEGRQFNLSDTDFSDKDITNSIIIGGIFDGMSMDYTDLSYSNLGYCSFKYASLMNSIIVKAEANDTNFENAKLNNCNFFRTTFIRTNFNQADLTNTNFSATLLKEADFSNAILDKCLFAGASLINARGLETVKLDWIDIGQIGCPKRLYGIDAIRWLLSEAEKPL